MVTLRQLHYLEVLAETLHFGNAAEVCAVSQPALSMQIKELEAELQVSLVERRKSGVALTEHGAEIARRARTILASVRDLLDHAQHGDRVLSGSLKLGAIPTIAPYLLRAALPELQRRFPELNLQLRETRTETLLHELVGCDLDLILIALPIDDPEIETLHYCRMLTPEARDSFDASSLATIVQMGANGYGITLLPEMAITREIHHPGDIRLLPFNPPEPKREIGLAWRKTSPRKTDFVQFAQLLLDVAVRLGKL
jgi:LysR family transcriptional regulator, hydrogen peroxide-inducible genes activator